MGNVMNNIYNQTFNLQSAKLPTVEELYKCIHLNQHNMGMFSKLRSDAQYEFKDRYTRKSFPILSDVLLTSFVYMIKELQLKRVVELNAGIGWLSYWLTKYNVPVFRAIDNKTWKGHEDHLPIITEADSIQYVKKHSGTDLYILSWPYMDDVALHIWQAMKKGQYLLYIGEGDGGCTANDKFHEVTGLYEVDDIWEMNRNAVSFWGIHDKPTLFKKDN